MDRPRLFSIDIAASVLPRTMTREEWRALDRWRRTVAREVERMMAPHIAPLMHDLVASGSCAFKIEPGPDADSPFSVEHMQDVFLGRRKR